MSTRFLFLLLLLFSRPAILADEPCWNGPKPCYVAAGVVNSADFQAGELAPGAIASIFGTGLAYNTVALTPEDLAGGQMPTTLPSSGVHVLVGSIPAPLLYVSPKQINFIIPSILLPGKVNLQVVLDSNAGPAVSVQIKPGAPALYQLDLQTAIAQRPDGSLYTPEAPARAGDWVTLYATGLGATTPPLLELEIPQTGRWIADVADFQVLLNSVPVDPALVSYVGVAPKFGGLNQVNLRLPPQFGAHPQIQLVLAGNKSPTGIVIPATP